MEFDIEKCAMPMTKLSFLVLKLGLFDPFKTRSGLETRIV